MQVSRVAAVQLDLIKRRNSLRNMVPLTTVKEKTSNFTIYLYCNIVYFVASMCDSVVARRVDLPGAGRRLAGSVRVCRVSRILRIFHTITVHTVLVLNTVINLNSNCRGSSWIIWKRNNNRRPPCSAWPASASVPARPPRIGSRRAWRLQNGSAPRAAPPSWTARSRTCGG